MTKQKLQPKCVFEHFARINEIPRPSKREEKIIAYLREFGEKLGLYTYVDEVGNVIIRKPATPGYEDRETIILQSHTDMVCDKLVDKQIDFDNDPITTYIDGEWLRAEGTTLGADDGIGVAMELALLDTPGVEHGPIECVFTRDEETGLTGAEGMKPDFMTGKLLINLDSEDEGQFFISCAGGRTTRAHFTYEKEAAPEGLFFIKASLKGLTGGHSGDDINKKRANAIKILTRFLYKEQKKMDLRLASFSSGRMHNAIPRDGEVVFAVPFAEKETVRVDWNIFTAEVEDEYHVTDTKMVFAMESTDAQEIIPAGVSANIIRALMAVDNGVFSMCQDEEIAWLVETSSNVASVQADETGMMIVSSQRSCVMSNLDNMCDTVAAAFEMAGAEVVTGEGYPAWKMNPNSKLTEITVNTYRELFGKEPRVIGIHAGLECGLFSERYPDMDMISMGPTLRDVHTPDERLLIPTVQMVWDHLLLILRNAPKK